MTNCCPHRPNLWQFRVSLLLRTQLSRDILALSPKPSTYLVFDCLGRELWILIPIQMLISCVLQASHLLSRHQFPLLEMNNVELGHKFSSCFVTL